ncbi:MAG: hypothetical protein ACRELW_12040 [Candidatus Rokuibacteriota bacterium]
MASVASRVALLAACFSLALPAAAWAGSTQATLAVGVVVPARCALRVAAALPSGDAGGDGQVVVMKCTKGTLPPGDASSPRRASAVGPRITRDVVLTSAPAAAAAPRPLTDQGPTQAALGVASSLVITVNF